MTTLFVAISGGHLAQLYRLAPRLASGPRIWVTDATRQSESLLAGESVFHVPTRPPRDWAGVLRDTAVVDRAIAASNVTRVISTGAQVALSAYLAASRRRIPFAYVESATRVTHLSTTGKILDRMPGVHRFVQHSGAAPSPKWSHRLSVFDGYSAAPAQHDGGIRKVVVTLGGNGEYAFRRLVERLASVIPERADVLWQLGSTQSVELPGRVVSSLPSHELQREMEFADVVIGHSGTGTVLAALSAGKLPLLAPRRAAFAEHVDEHQVDLARAVAQRNLAVVREAHDIALSDLIEAAQFRVEHEPSQELVDLFGKS